MHIGGMRTALFNWLWARHNGGQFILRIDDTDQQRNVESALQPILRAFRWLSLNWDEGPEVGGDCGPYFQSQRGDIYRASVDELLKAGLAYRDFTSPEQTRIEREAAEKAKQNYLNNRDSQEFSESTIREKIDSGEPHVIRFLMPRGENRRLKLTDLILGDVEWNVSEMPDPVIMRSDGSALYNMATVVDDAGMQISHVIRAQEHLSNTPIQILLHEALGNTLPEYAHIPYVAAPGSKEKLSKREKKIEKYRNSPQFKKLFDAADEVFPKLGLGSSETLNPVMVEYYEKMGYLPAAVLNALARLGWSLDDKTEILSLDEVVSHFTLDRVIKSPAGLDPDKLLSFQTHWIGQLSVEEKVAGVMPFLIQAGYAPEPPADATVAFVTRLVRVLDDRLKLFSDVLGYEEYFVADESLCYSEPDFNKRIRQPDDAADLLRRFRAGLAEVESFDAATLDRLLHDFVAQEGIKIGQIIHAIRIAVTGKATGPGMFDCLELLGRDRVLNRIDRALTFV